MKTTRNFKVTVNFLLCFVIIDPCCCPILCGCSRTVTVSVEMVAQLKAPSAFLLLQSPTMEIVMMMEISLRTVITTVAKE